MRNFTRVQYQHDRSDNIPADKQHKNIRKTQTKSNRKLYIITLLWLTYDVQYDGQT